MLIGVGYDKAKSRAAFVADWDYTQTLLILDRLLIKA
jgi:hypothetical protein